MSKDGIHPMDRLRHHTGLKEIPIKPPKPKKTSLFETDDEYKGE